MDNKNSKRIEILGIKIDNIFFKEALLLTERLVKQCSPSYIVTPNVDHLITLQRDVLFKKIYEEADLVLADGVPLLWAAKLLGTPLEQRITGADLLPALCELASKNGYKIFLLGGLPGVAEKASNVLKNRYYGINIVGTYCPPFGFEFDFKQIDKICEVVRNSKPDILFVGLGAPKQEKFIWKHRMRMGVPLSLGVGAAIDFIAGTKKRAPMWIQKIGLEWFFRMVLEPKRLLKRYLIKDIAFFFIVYKEWLKKRKSR